MSGERAGFVNVDELMAQVSLAQVLTFYRVELPDLRRIGAEIRTRCLSLWNCGRPGETGDRALATRAGAPGEDLAVP